MAEHLGDLEVGFAQRQLLGHNLVALGQIVRQQTTEIAQFFLVDRALGFQCADLRQPPGNIFLEARDAGDLPHLLGARELVETVEIVLLLQNSFSSAAESPRSVRLLNTVTILDLLGLQAVEGHTESTRGSLDHLVLARA